MYEHHHAKNLLTGNGDTNQAVERTMPFARIGAEKAAVYQELMNLYSECLDMRHAAGFWSENCTLLD
jgi:hypothetical protein